MKLVSGVLGFALTSAVALASANAADMYRAPAAGGYKDGPAPILTWSGFYIGANGGGAWSDSTDQFSYYGYGGGLNPSGGFGGGQIGYNWQGLWNPNLVVGIEADIQGAGINDDVVAFDGTHAESSLDWFGTVRGRIGYAFDRSLIYFTGGFAYGGLRHTIHEAGGYVTPTNGTKTFVPGGVYKYDDTATGYVLGGGWEYKVNPAWSVKVEYQYLNFGNNDPVDYLNGYGGAKFNGYKVEDDAYHTVRVGVNYHFQPAFEPLK